MFWWEMYFKLARINDDKNMFYEHPSKQTITTKDDLKLNFRESDLNSGNFFDIYFSVNTTHTIIDRRYLKLPGMLARVFAMSVLLKYFLV